MKRMLPLLMMCGFAATTAVGYQGVAHEFTASRVRSI